MKTKSSVHVFDNAGGGYVTCLIYTKDDQVLSGGGDGTIKSWSVSVRFPRLHHPFIFLALLLCRRWSFGRFSQPNTTARFLHSTGMILPPPCGLAVSTKLFRGGTDQTELSSRDCTYVHTDSVKGG